MTAELMRWQMGDPLKVLMSIEAADLKRSCLGCAHAVERQTPFNDTIIKCLKGRPYGKKCSQYARSGS